MNETPWHQLPGGLVIQKPPSHVGGWRVGGPTWSTTFNVTKKPRWLTRVLMRLLLEWEWVDAKDKV